MKIADLTSSGSWLSRCNRWLASWRGRAFLGAAVAAAYLYAYWTHPELPGTSAAYPLGWWGWWDQGQFLKCAAGLARGSLTQDTYWYPLGYPALGALFYRVMPQHAFLVPNLILVMGSAILFYEIAKKLISPVEAILLLVVFAACYHGTTALSVVEPWNTIPTHFLTYAVILLVAFGRIDRTRLLLGALCVGLMYLCRLPDAACVGLILLVAILGLRSWSEKVIAGFSVAIILALFIGAVLLINWSIFRSWRTPYEMISASIGFGSFPLAEKAYALIIDAKPIFHEDEAALLLHFPWLVLLPPGAVFFVRKYGWRAVGVLLSIAGTYGIYFAYNDFWPGNIFRYHLIHYLFWTLPLLALLVYVGLREAWKDRIGRLSFALILPILVPTCFLTLKENALGRIAPPTSARLMVPPTDERRLDWILLTGVRTKPDPLKPEFSLTAFQDFITIGRTDGRLTLLASRARNHPIAVEPADAQDCKAIVYGTLDWRLRWPPRPLGRRTQSRDVNVILRRTADGIDVTGPRGIPDGRPDQVVEVQLDEESAHTIAEWDIETSDPRGHWVSNANSQGWWLIKIEPLPRNGTQPKRVHLRLIFPDYGDFERAAAFALRATDIDGNLVVERTIPK